MSLLKEYILDGYKDNDITSIGKGFYPYYNTEEHLMLSLMINDPIAVEKCLSFLSEFRKEVQDISNREYLSKWELKHEGLTYFAFFHISDKLKKQAIKLNEPLEPCDYTLVYCGLDWDYSYTNEAKNYIDHLCKNELKDWV